MAGVQIFSESPISPAIQRKDVHTLAVEEEGYAEGNAVAHHELSRSAPNGTTALVSSDVPQIKTDSIVTTSPVRNDSDRYDSPTPRSCAASPQRILPPPPKAGERLQPSSYYAVSPGQMSESVSLTHLPPRSTSASPRTPPIQPQYSTRDTLLSPSSPPYSALQTPQTAPLPRKSLEHPPGYVQNPYAADLTPEQRFAVQHGSASPTLGYGSNSGGGSTGGLLGAKSPSSVLNFGALISPVSARNDGILGGPNNGDEDVWSLVGGWFKGMGKKVEKVESEVWKRINEERD